MVKSSAACLICRTPAKQATAKVGDYSEINCPKCGQFQVSGTYQAVIKAHTAEVRRQSLERARTRARYGLLPLLTTYDLP